MDEIQEFDLRTKPQSKSGKKTSKQVSITNNDRLRFIEAMLSDQAMPLMVSSQEVLNRQELDARNSVMKVQDCFAKVAEVFNRKIR